MGARGLFSGGGGGGGSDAVYPETCAMSGVSEGGVAAGVVLRAAESDGGRRYAVPVRGVQQSGNPKDTQRYAGRWSQSR